MEATDQEHSENCAGTLAAADVAAGGSPVDMQLLQTLDAKIKELTALMEAEAKEAKPPRRRPLEITPPPIPESGPDCLPAAPLPLDSTQTVRPLTSREVETYEAARWFAIQLVLSSDPIDLAQVPNLGIFAEYRLYLVSAPVQGQRTHALRLGFFSSEIAAVTVVRYLFGYFPLATITRVSIAERERFAEQGITAGKDVGAHGRRVNIELLGASTGRFGYASLQHPLR